MNRINRLSTVYSVLFCLLPLVANAQQEVTISAQEVAPGIHMLQGQGGNIGLFTGSDATFMIDDQFAPLTPKILAAVEAAGGKRPDFLLNTHYHFDHTGGNENLGNAGTLILSHDNVRLHLANGAYLAPFKKQVPPTAAPGLPVATFGESLTLHINGETVRARHVPFAHTDGDSFVVFEKANVIHAGDVFFNGFFPFIDVEHGGSLRGMLAGADAILAHCDDATRIIPGHGPLGTRADLVAFRDMLATALERLLALKIVGKSAAEAIAAAPLADLEARWNGGFLGTAQWIEVVYPGVY